MKDTPREPRPGRVRASLSPGVAAAFTAFMLFGSISGALGVLLPSLGTQYQITKGTAGTLYLAITAGYAVIALASGPLIAQLGLWRFLLAGAFCLLAGTASLSVAPPFAVVELCTLLLGIGIACLDIGFNSFIAARPHSTVQLNDLHAFYGTGALLGPILASVVLAFGLQWNAVYVVWTAGSLLLVAGLAAVFRGRPQNTASLLARGESPGQLLAMVARMHALWWAALFLILYVGTEVGLGSWSYTFLVEGRHGQPLVMGWVVSGFWAAFTLGRFTLARSAHRLSEMHLIYACLLGAAASIAVMLLVPLGVGAAVGLWIAGFSLGPIYPTVIALLPKLVSNRLLAGAIGFLASIGSLGGAVFPWLIGNIMQGFGSAALAPVAAILAVLMLVSATALGAQRRSVAS